MKLYYPKSHYYPKSRRNIFPLLKPFIKESDFSDVQRIAIYGVSEQDFEVVNTLEEADVSILPMAWNYYLHTNTVSTALDFINHCNTLQKSVWAFNAGDFGVQMPKIPNLIVFRFGGYHSQFTTHEHTLPPFIADPLQKYFNSDCIFQQSYESKPRIGFCGQAQASRLHAFTEILKTAGRNVKSYIGLSKTEPQQLVSTSFLRASILKRLQEATEVQTNFILRKQYRAGIKENKDVHQTTLEFYDNINQSDYVVCVRGAGNFSVRFYETLAMGRIPVFINTDCSLPLDKKIPWRTHVVWVEYGERHRVAQKVTEFHQALSETDFIALQHANRNLWKEQLTTGGFFKSFFNTNH